MYCFLPIVLIIVGSCLFLRGVFILSRPKAIQKNWIKVHARIINSMVESASEVMRYNFSIEYFYPSASYEYEVNGHKICGYRVSVEKKGLWTESNEEAQDMLNQIRTSHVVYYNPSNVRDAVIAPALSKMRMSHNWSLVVSGVVLICMGGIFCLINSI